MLKLRGLLVLVAILLLTSAALAADGPLNGSMAGPFTAIGGDPAHGSTPANWGVWGDVNTNITRGQSTTNSPFTALFPNNSSSFYMNDQAIVTTASTGMAQTWTTGYTTGRLSFDFMVNSSSAGVSNGEVGIQFNNNGTSAPADNLTLVRFNVNDTENYLTWSNGKGQSGNILKTSNDTWYHLDSVFDTSAHTISGSVTPYGGAAATFTGILATPAIDPNANLISGVMIRDRAISAGGMLYLDNVTVPEPSSLVLLVAAGFGLLAYAWRKRT